MNRAIERKVSKYSREKGKYNDIEQEKRTQKRKKERKKELMKERRKW